MDSVYVYILVLFAWYYKNGLFFVQGPVEMKFDGVRKKNVTLEIVYTERWRYNKRDEEYSFIYHRDIYPADYVPDIGMWLRRVAS